MKNILFLFFCMILAISLNAADRVAVLPFTDKAKIKSNWDLSRGVAEYISVYWKDYENPVSADTVFQLFKSRRWKASDAQKDAVALQIAEALRVRYLVAGEVLEFYAVKKMAGSGDAGGYKHYNAGIKAKMMIYDALDKKWAEVFPVESHKRNAGLRINLPGKLSSDEENFYQIERQPFGSDVFRKTVAGEAMDDMAKQILEKFRSVKAAAPVLPEPAAAAPRPVTVFEGRILSLSDSIVYIDLGADDSIRTGERFPVYTRGKPILHPETGDTLDFTDTVSGEVEITFIKSSGMCSARVISGTAHIGDRVRVTRSK